MDSTNPSPTARNDRGCVSDPRCLTPTGKLIWFIVTYVLWDSAYTVSDVPIYNLVTMMTTNLNERNSILSLARLFALIGAFITGMLTPILVSERWGSRLETPQ